MYYCVYFAYSQSEIWGEIDESQPIFPPQLARVGKYTNRTQQLNAYSNTFCENSIMFEVNSDKEFEQKVEQYKKNFQDENWVRENVLE